MEREIKSEEEMSLCEEAVKVRLGMRIRQLRKEKMITQEQFSYITSLHRNYISDVERGKRNVSIVAIYRIAQGLSVEIKDLF